MSLRRSGLQKEVLALYRRSAEIIIPLCQFVEFKSHCRALRMVSTKPPAAQSKFRLYVRYTFRTQAASVSPRDISAIEHMLRKGRRQLEMYEDSQVRNCFVSNDMLQWDARNAGRRESTAETSGATP